MENVVIIDAVRTPMGRSKGGAFRHVRAEDLSAHLMRELLSRHPAVNAATLDDIVWGCVQQTLEQGFNIARNAALLAEIPHVVPPQRSTVCVDPQCRPYTMPHAPLWWEMHMPV